MQTYSIFSSDDDSESLPDLTTPAGSSVFTDNGNEIELENSVNIPVPVHDYMLHLTGISSWKVRTAYMKVLLVLTVWIWMTFTKMGTFTSMKE